MQSSSGLEINIWSWKYTALVLFIKGNNCLFITSSSISVDFDKSDWDKFGVCYHFCCDFKNTGCRVLKRRASNSDHVLACVDLLGLLLFLVKKKTKTTKKQLFVHQPSLFPFPVLKHFFSAITHCYLRAAESHGINKGISATMIWCSRIWHCLLVINSTE